MKNKRVKRNGNTETVFVPERKGRGGGGGGGVRDGEGREGQASKVCPPLEGKNVILRLQPWRLWEGASAPVLPSGRHYSPAFSPQRRQKL